MTTEQFFEKFELFAGAPDAIPRLRQLILELAVRAQLTAPTQPSTPTNPSAPSDSSAEPFPIPEDWQWVRLSQAADTRAASKVSPSTISDASWVLDLEDIDGASGTIVGRATFAERRSQSTKAAFVPGDVLYGKLRPYLNKVVVAEHPGFCTTEIIPLRPKTGVSAHFLRLWLRSPSFLKFAEEKSYGMKMPRLGTKDLESSAVPIPPLAEQKRIVAKVDELMALCDQLEAQQQERETKHAGLSAASLARFAEAPTPSNLNFLFHHSYDISPAELRNLIIDAASRGALSPAVITGKPVREALATRRSKRLQAWVKLKGRSKDYEEPDRVEYDDFPMLPKHWGLEYLGLLGEDQFYAVQTGPFGSQLLKTEFVECGVPVVAVGNLTGLGFSSKRLYHITKEKALQLSRYDVQAGDLLFARTGATLGKVCLAPNEAKDWRMTGHILRVRLDTDTIDPRLVVLFLWASEFVKKQVSGGIRGMTRPGFNTGLLERILIPIPPLAEQKRIVAKVDELMALVDQLEEQLASSRTLAAQLTEAVVAELTAAA